MRPYPLMHGTQHRPTVGAVALAIARVLPIILSGVAVLGTAVHVAADEWVSAPTLRKTGAAEWQLEFAVDRATDVEVAIVDPGSNRIIRHLAAGVLGPKAPAPLQRNSLAQKLSWDGRNDYGELAKSAAPVARVRTGSSVALDTIIGGDPYGWYSGDNGDGDHYAWSMTQAIDAKANGTVFIYGNSGPLGSPMIRQYDATGTYLKTVFPPPADLNLAAVKHWGVRLGENGSYSPVFSNFDWQPTLSDSYVVNPYRTHIGMFVANPHDNSSLTVMTTEEQGVGKLQLQRIGVDGSITANSKIGRLISSPALPGNSARIGGNFFTAYANDARHLYVSSLYDTARYANTDDFYHDGKIFKVDTATGEASTFFDQGVPAGKTPGVNRKRGFSQLHGIAVDAADNVFVCDRVNNQVIALDASGKTIRTLAVPNPDNVAVGKDDALYVTTRDTHHRKGKVQLYKFSNWRSDDRAAQQLPIASIIDVPDATDIQVVPNGNEPRVWVSYPSAPVLIFRDTPRGLVLDKDFAKVNTQSNLAINSVHVDTITETLYVTDSFSSVFVVDDWAQPRFRQARQGPREPLVARSVAIDERNRWLYTRGGTSRGPIERWQLDAGQYFPPAPIASGDNALTPTLYADWIIRSGHADLGFDIGPTGGLAVAAGFGSPRKSDLKYFKRDESQAPWNATVVSPQLASSARMDLQGNIYAGIYDGPPTKLPKGYESDPFYRTNADYPLVSRIYRFAATDLANDELYPATPAGPDKIYDVAFGMTSKRQPASFDVDGYGRIAYPTAINQKVSLIDNEGNSILSFGRYGNPDDKGTAAIHANTASDIPLAYGHTVAMSDDYLYVGDLSNNRVLRIALRHQLEAQVPVSD